MAQVYDTGLQRYRFQKIRVSGKYSIPSALYSIISPLIIQLQKRRTMFLNFYHVTMQNCLLSYLCVQSNQRSYEVAKQCKKCRLSLFFYVHNLLILFESQFFIDSHQCFIINARHVNKIKLYVNFKNVYTLSL